MCVCMSRFLLHLHLLANSAMMNKPNVGLHCRLGDETAREGSDHQPSYAEAREMKPLKRQVKSIVYCYCNIHTVLQHVMQYRCTISYSIKAARIRDISVRHLQNTVIISSASKCLYSLHLTGSVLYL